MSSVSLKPVQLFRCTGTSIIRPRCFFGFSRRTHQEHDHRCTENHSLSGSYHLPSSDNREEQVAQHEARYEIRTVKSDRFDDWKIRVGTCNCSDSSHVEPGGKYTALKRIGTKVADAFGGSPHNNDGVEPSLLGERSHWPIRRPL